MAVASSILAGLTDSVALTRALLRQPLLAVRELHPNAAPDVFVDDMAQLAVAPTLGEAMRIICPAAVALARGLETAGGLISEKTTIVASSRKLARQVRRELLDGVRLRLRIADSMRDLGVDLTLGSRRRVPILLRRQAQAWRRARRSFRMARVRLGARKLATSGVAPQQGWATAVSGVAPSQLRRMRHAMLLAAGMRRNADGAHSGDPRLRRVGWGLVHLEIRNGAPFLAGAAFGGVGGRQTVPLAELRGLFEGAAQLRAPVVHHLDTEVVVKACRRGPGSQQGKWAAAWQRYWCLPAIGDRLQGVRWCPGHRTDEQACRLSDSERLVSLGNFVADMFADCAAELSRLSAHVVRQVEESDVLVREVQDRLVANQRQHLKDFPGEVARARAPRPPRRRTTLRTMLADSRHEVQEPSRGSRKR